MTRTTRGLLATTAALALGASLLATGGGDAVGASPHGTTTRVAAAPDVFGSAPSRAARVAPDLTLTHPKRTRYVSFRSDLLPRVARGQKVTLGFFDDARLTGEITHIDHQPTYDSWSGTLPGQIGNFVVVKSNDTYQVMASTSHGAYTMRQTSAGLYQVEEANPPHHLADDERSGPLPAAKAGAQAGAAAPAAPATASPASTTPRVVTNAVARRTRGGDDGSVEDILVVFTAAAEAAYGGPAGIYNQAVANIAATNMDYLQSGVGTTARLAGVLPVSGTEKGGGLDSDLNRLTRGGDGAFDETQTYIKQYHADDTLMLEKPYVDGAGACGVGWLERNQPVKRAFAVVATGDCTAGYPTFPHELGHNQGAAHDRYAVRKGGSSGGRPQYPYGYGYVPPNCAFRTTMAYADYCLEKYNIYTDQVFQFSTPNVIYQGQPAGTKKNNVAKLITKTRKRMAQHQQSQLYPTPVHVKPAPRLGARVRASFSPWVNKGVRYHYQWYVDGKPRKHAHHRTYRPTRKDVGKKLSVLVTGTKRYYTPAAIGSGARKVKGHRKHRHHHRNAAAPGVASDAGLLRLFGFERSIAG